MKASHVSMTSNLLLVAAYFNTNLRRKEENEDAAFRRKNGQSYNALAARISEGKHDCQEKTVELMEKQQKIFQDQGEMSIMCANTDGLSEFGKEYLLLKQRQVLEEVKKQT
ncbi:No apical meristem-associated, C-terminal domain [Phytophthora cactorum]|nr:No apical meristem-associated, C-terminal domain [Phytophthora cactorum]